MRPSSPFNAGIGLLRQRKQLLRPCLLAERCYRISCRSYKTGELLVRNFQTLSHNPNLHAIIQVKLVALARSVASVHRNLQDVWEGGPTPANVTALFLIGNIPLLARILPPSREHTAWTKVPPYSKERPAKIASAVTADPRIKRMYPASSFIKFDR